MTRPRQGRRKRPGLAVLLVAVATIAVGSGSGLVLARMLDQPETTLADSTVQLSPPGDSRQPTGGDLVPVTPTASSTTTGSTVPSRRPTAAPTRASRSQPSRTPSSSTTTRRPSSRPATSSPAVQKATGVPGLESAVLALVNAERDKAGCSAVRTSSKLTSAARKHSQYMADTGRHGHDGIGDGTPQSRIEATGYRWSSYGENIAWGYRTAASVMDGWMNSTGHRKNILNCSFTDIGVGVDRGGTNWTQVFGTPR